MQVCIQNSKGIDCYFTLLHSGNQRDFIFETSAQLLIFTSPVVRTCVDIGIIDDNDVEGDHHFELLIEAVAPGRVLPTSALTVITITDNLGMMLPSLNESVNYCLY